jgi:hypothetical protein
MAPQTFCTYFFTPLYYAEYNARAILLRSQSEKTRGEDKTATMMMIGSKVVFFQKERCKRM